MITWTEFELIFEQRFCKIFQSEFYHSKVSIAAGVEVG